MSQQDRFAWYFPWSPSSRNLVEIMLTMPYGCAMISLLGIYLCGTSLHNTFFFLYHIVCIVSEISHFAFVFSFVCSAAWFSERVSLCN